MGCSTKNAKVVAISLGSLQRLIALKAVPQSAVPLIINTMTVAMSQGVDIQLRILQTLVSLVPNFPDIHGNLLGDVRPSPVHWLPKTHFFYNPGATIMFQTSRISDCRRLIHGCCYSSTACYVRGGQDGFRRSNQRIK